MNVSKYRKLYLSENWGENRFVMIKYDVEFNQIRRNTGNFTIDLQRNHPWVLSHNAYWINHKQLCIGYKLNENHDIFRPIFSHKRQIFMDNINSTIKTQYGNKCKKHSTDNLCRWCSCDPASIKQNFVCCPPKFWNKVKAQYFYSIITVMKKLPTDCINNIVCYIH